MSGLNLRYLVLTKQHKNRQKVFIKKPTFHYERWVDEAPAPGLEPGTG